MKARAAASAAVIAVLTILLSACGLTMPPATQNPYDPSEGINASVGELDLRNMLVVTEDGQLGNLMVTLVNASSNTIQVALQYESDGEKQTINIPVDGDSSVNVGFGDGGQQLLEGINSPAGTLLPIYVQYGDVPGEQLQVPVIDAADGYPGFAPTPTPTPTPEATETPAPDEDAEG